MEFLDGQVLGKVNCVGYPLCRMMSHGRVVLCGMDDYLVIGRWQICKGEASQEAMKRDSGDSKIWDSLPAEYGGGLLCPAAPF